MAAEEINDKKTPPLANPKPAPADETNKREAARIAMQGPEWTTKIKQEEEVRKLTAERSQLKTRLGEIAREKERLESLWIELDDQRKLIRQTLNPILEEEKKIEAAEADLEAEEASIGVPTEKHPVEQKRWAVQEQRKNIEGRKWAEEEKLVKIEAKIEEHTQTYRRLLAEEDQIQAELEKLGGEVVI